jgi:hypothetical protein
MMAHINTSGVHVPLWLDAEAPQIGWGTSSTYPKQEGTFFGNIIETGDLTGIGMTGVTGPAAYFCEGAGITAGVVSGRLTSGATNVPYKNPYGDKVQCSSGTTVAGPFSAGQTAPDGYKQACAKGYCFQNGEPITVWRNPTYTPVFDQVYRYTLVPTSASDKSMDVASDGVSIQQFTVPSGGAADDQKFAVVANGSNWNIVRKSDSTKCVGQVTGDVRVQVQACDTSNTSQAWSVTANANTGAFTVKNVASGKCLEVTYGNNSDGAMMDVYDCWGGSNQLFNMKAGY